MYKRIITVATLAFVVAVAVGATSALGGGADLICIW